MYLNAIHENDPNTAEATNPIRYNNMEIFKEWKINNNGGINITDHQRISEEGFDRNCLTPGKLSIIL